MIEQLVTTVNPYYLHVTNKQLSIIKRLVSYSKVISEPALTQRDLSSKQFDLLKSLRDCAHCSRKKQITFLLVECTFPP